MIMPFVTLCGPDNYLCRGLATLLNDMASVLPPPSPLTVVVLPRMGLLDMVNYCAQLRTEKDYIVIGPSQAQALLSCSSMLKIHAFIDITLPLPQLFHSLHQALTTPCTRTDANAAVRITRREHIVMNFLIKGKGVVKIASLTGHSFKTISAQKRSLMRKLHVTREQELLCKLKLIRDQKDKN